SGALAEAPSFARPFGRFVPGRGPPRRPDDMSRVEVLDDCRASPVRARSLLTVRAAISLARLVDAPRSLALSFTCSYCRSRLFLHAFCRMDAGCPRGGRLNAIYVSGSFWTLCSVA